MNDDSRTMPRPRVLASPVFWMALVGVVVATSISATLWFFQPSQTPDAERDVRNLLGMTGMALTQGGALIWGLLRARDNRPLGLGLLIGLLIIDLSPFILALLLGLVILLGGGLHDV